MLESNPYHTSSASTPSAERSTHRPSSRPAAPLGKRLVASIVDSLFMMAFVVPAMIFLGWSKVGQGDLATQIAHRSILLACAIPYFAINGYLVGLTGQTLGKRLTRIQIRKLDDTLPSSWEWFWKRNLPLLVVNQIPWLGGWIGMANYLMVFGKQSRCGHDFLAGTRVVEL